MVSYRLQEWSCRIYRAKEVLSAPFPGSLSWDGKMNLFPPWDDVMICTQATTSLLLRHFNSTTTTDNASLREALSYGWTTKSRAFTALTQLKGLCNPDDWLTVKERKQDVSKHRQQQCVCSYLLYSPKRGLSSHFKTVRHSTVLQLKEEGQSFTFATRSVPVVAINNNGFISSFFSSPVRCFVATYWMSSERYH